jgi:hypothetical protein
MCGDDDRVDEEGGRDAARGAPARDRDRDAEDNESEDDRIDHV